MKDKKAVLVSFVIERNDDGYLASVPSIQGAFAEGDSIEEAIFNCVDVLKMIFTYRSERSEPIGVDTISLSSNTKMTVALSVYPQGHGRGDYQRGRPCEVIHR